MRGNPAWTARAKLTEDDVREIRRAYAQPNHLTMAQLAKLYGVSAPAICHVVMRDNYKRVA